MTPLPFAWASIGNAAEPLLGQDFLPATVPTHVKSEAKSHDVAGWSPASTRSHIHDFFIQLIYIYAQQISIKEVSQYLHSRYLKMDGWDEGHEFWSWLMVSDVESPIQPWNFVGSTSILRELILRFPWYTLLQLAWNEMWYQVWMGVAWAEKQDPPSCKDDYTPPTRSWDITPLNEEPILGHMPLVSSCFGPIMSVHRKFRWWKCMKIRTS